MRTLVREIKDSQIVGLGEAAHGTHEFFEEKARIIKYLVGRDNYRAIGFDWTERAIAKINDYVQGKPGEIVPLLNSFRLYNSEEILSLFEWIRDFNLRRKPEDRIFVFGFDDPSFQGDPASRGEKMFEKVKQKLDSLRSVKTILWAHNAHLVKDPETADQKGMGYYLAGRYGNGYYTIGTDAYEGVAYTIGRTSYESNDFRMEETSMSARLAREGAEGIFLPLRDAPAGKLTILNIPSVWTGDISRQINTEKDLDAILFFRKTTKSQMLAGNPVN